MVEGKTYECPVCGRKYAKQEQADGCKTFWKTTRDWVCKPPRGSDKW